MEVLNVPISTIRICLITRNYGIISLQLPAVLYGYYNYSIRKHLLQCIMNRIYINLLLRNIYAQTTMCSNIYISQNYTHIHQNTRMHNTTTTTCTTITTSTTSTTITTTTTSTTITTTTTSTTITTTTTSTTITTIQPSLPLQLVQPSLPLQPIQPSLPVQLVQPSQPV